MATLQPATGSPKPCAMLTPLSIWRVSPKPAHGRITSAAMRSLLPTCCALPVKPERSRDSCMSAAWLPLGLAPRPVRLTELDPPRPVSAIRPVQTCGGAGRAAIASRRKSHHRTPARGLRPARCRRVPDDPYHRSRLDDPSRQAPAAFQPYLCGRLGGWLNRCSDYPASGIKPDGRTFYLAHPTPVSWEEFGNVAARLMGRNCVPSTIPEKAAYVLGLGADCWTRIKPQATHSVARQSREACCAGWVCDPARARRDLGFCALTGLEAGLRVTLNWYGRRVGSVSSSRTDA